MRRVEVAHPEKHLLFRQVYDHVVGRIERGEWKANQKLPSVRQLADSLGVHRLTVFRAYQMLKQNGIAYVKEKSGYFVIPGLTELTVDESGGNGFHVSSQKVRNSLSEIQRVSVRYQFSQSLIDPNLLPNLYLSQYVKRVFDIYPKLLSTYASVQGDEELRTVLCHYMVQRHNIQLHPDNLLITTGAQQAIDLLARSLLRPFDLVMVERPTYSAALDIFRQHSVRFIPVEIYPEGYDLEQVESFMKKHKPRIFYMNPTFQNPTGYTVPAWQRKRLVELAEKYRCLLIEDDAFHDMYFNARPPLPLLAYDTEGWVVYLRSFSKYVAPGLRICVTAAPKGLMQSLITAKSLADNGTPLVTQKIFLHYFGSQRMQEHLEKLRIALQIRRDTAERELALSDWEWVSPTGGLNLWLQLPDSLSAAKLLKECMQRSISFVPGTMFDPLFRMNSWIRVSYSLMNERQLGEGLRQVVEIADLMKTNNGDSGM